MEHSFTYLSKFSIVTYRCVKTKESEVFILLKYKFGVKWPVSTFVSSNLCKCHDYPLKNRSDCTISRENSFNTFSRRRNFSIAIYQTPDGHKSPKVLHFNDRLETTWVRCTDIKPRNPWWDGLPDLKWWCMVSALKFPERFRNTKHKN